MVGIVWVTFAILLVVDLVQVGLFLKCTSAHKKTLHSALIFRLHVSKGFVHTLYMHLPNTKHSFPVHERWLMCTYELLIVKL